MHTIDRSKNDKAPGLDGFTAEFYKFKRVLATKLCKLFNGCVSAKQIPSS